MNWDYLKKHVTLSIPVYVKGAIHEYQHKNPTIPYNTPRKWQGPEYGAKTQWAANDSNIPILQPEDIKYTQNVVGNSDGPTILLALITLSAAQPKETEDTKKEVAHLLDY